MNRAERRRAATFGSVTDKYDPVKAVMSEYAPPSELAKYMDEKKLKSIENSVDPTECGFED